MKYSSKLYHQSQAFSAQRDSAASAAGRCGEGLLEGWYSPGETEFASPDLWGGRRNRVCDSVGGGSGTFVPGQRVILSGGVGWVRESRVSESERQNEIKSWRAVQYCAAMQCNIVQHNTAQFSATQRNAMQCNTIHRSKAQRNAMQCNAIQHSTTAQPVTSLYEGLQLVRYWRRAHLLLLLPIRKQAAAAVSPFPVPIPIPIFLPTRRLGLIKLDWGKMVIGVEVFRWWR
jgi:hypothetical protein